MSDPAAKSIPDGTLADLGEFGLISALTARLPQGKQVLLGPGDDAAVVSVSGDVVVTTDVLVSGVHFRTDWSAPYDIGRRAAAASLSDVAAMGAAAGAIVVALTAPSTLEVAWVLRLTDGLRDEAQCVDASVVGGDLSHSSELAITVTALGDLAGGRAVTRSGATSGDVVALCGRLGWAEAGLAVLRRGFRSPRALVEAYGRPDPPYAAGPAAAAAGATAMCDVSDGLLADLGHIAAASQVGIDLDGSALTVSEPIRSVAAAYAVDPLEWVLTGGHDHALVATFPASAHLPAGFSVIGQVVSGRGVTVDGASDPVGELSGSQRAARQSASGHQHFLD